MKLLTSEDQEADTMGENRQVKEHTVCFTDLGKLKMIRGRP